MTRTAIPALVMIAAALIAACAAPQPQPADQQPSGPTIAEGSVTGVGDAHGNLYTSIGPDEYESLGLEPGRRINVTFDDTAVTLIVGRAYTDVSTGAPVAVLHREGLTFAIRDGDFSSTHGVTIGAPFTISDADGGR